MSGKPDLFLFSLLATRLKNQQKKISKINAPKNQEKLQT